MPAEMPTCFEEDVEMLPAPLEKAYDLSGSLSLQAAPERLEESSASSVSSFDNFYQASEDFNGPQTYDVCPPQPRFQPGAPTREAFDASPHYPLIISPNPVAESQVFQDSPSLDAGVDFNNGGSVHFETSLFVGRFGMHLKGLDSTQPGIFNGRRRLQHLVVQGRFKRPLLASSWWTGHEFYDLPSFAPTSFIKMIFTAAAKMFSSSVMISPELDQTGSCGFMNPLFASCQVLNVSRPGSEPDMWSATEDCRLLSPELSDGSGRPVSGDKRRKWFDQAANRQQVVISPDHVVTIHLWQHFADLAAYKLHLGFPVDLKALLMGQPLQIMAKDITTGEYVINLCIWHKNLLFAGDRGSSPMATSSSGSSISSGSSNSDEQEHAGRRPTLGATAATALRGSFKSFLGRK